MHSVLLLVRFRAVGAGFDAALRDALRPGIGLAPGLRAVFAGRMGPGDDGERLLASVWADDGAAQAAIDAGRAPIRAGRGAPRHARTASSTAARRRDARARRGARISILRVVSGITRPGELGRLPRRGPGGNARRPAIGEGPLALYLGRRPARPVRHPLAVGRLVARRGRHRRRPRARRPHAPRRAPRHLDGRALRGHPGLAWSIPPRRRPVPWRTTARWSTAPSSRPSPPPRSSGRVSGACRSRRSCRTRRGSATGRRARSTTRPGGADLVSTIFSRWRWPRAAASRACGLALALGRPLGLPRAHGPGARSRASAGPAVIVPRPACRRRRDLVAHRAVRRGRRRRRPGRWPAAP